MYFYHIALQFTILYPRTTLPGSMEEYVHSISEQCMKTNRGLFSCPSIWHFNIKLERRVEPVQAVHTIAGCVWLIRLTEFNHRVPWISRTKQGKKGSHHYCACIERCILRHTWNGSIKSRVQGLKYFFFHQTHMTKYTILIVQVPLLFGFKNFKWASTEVKSSLTSLSLSPSLPPSLSLRFILSYLLIPTIILRHFRYLGIRTTLL